MNKQFFAIIILALVGPLNGMDKSLYPHDYVCAKHHYNVSYPHPVEIVKLTAALTHKYELKEFWVNRQEDEWFDRFQDGKAPLVIALKDFHNYCQTKELESCNQKITQETAQLCQLLARPIGYDGNYLPPQENNFYWNRLRDQLANPNIIRWENILNERPALWKEAEKAALSANVLGSRKPDYFKKLLVPNIAKFLAAVFNAQSLFYCLKLDEKDMLINQERAAKEAAQRTLNAKQQADNANAAALRNLEEHKEIYLRSMREKFGQLFDASQTPPQLYQMENAGWAQNIANRLNNPTPQDIQNGIQLLQDENSHNLCELIIKTSQVNPQNAKALILTVISHVRDATVQAYACPLLEKLNKANANLTQAQEQQRKTQADLEAAQKGKADAESAVTSIRNAKEAQKTSFDTEIRNIERQQNQRNESARRMLGDLQREISPLRRELPTLRTRVREQDIEIQALRRAIAPQNQQ